MPNSDSLRREEGVASSSDAVLKVRDLSVTFATRQGLVRAVDGLNLDVGPRQVVGIVGESGSGKSVAMYSMLGLVRDANASITGHVEFEGRDILGLPDRQMQPLRGGQIGMIFQDPMTALTPVFSVGWQIVEQIRQHTDMNKSQAKEHAIALLAEVGIPDARRRADSFPHEFSGGMRQRVVIAMALSCNPKLLIADEPTTALDVTTQAQILELMGRLRDTHGSSIVIITHDMGVIAEMADRVTVMYAGRPIESGAEIDVVRSPRHPYTWGLLGAVPRLGERRERLATIPGNVMSPLDVPEGCAFAPRCEYAMAQCVVRPAMTGHDHLHACWLSEEQSVTIRTTALEAL